jgi:hypothetical protein
MVFESNYGDIFTVAYEHLHIRTYTPKNYTPSLPLYGGI